MKKVVALILSLVLLLGLCSMAQAAVKIPLSADETLASSLDVTIDHPEVKVEQVGDEVILTFSKNLDEYEWWGSNADYQNPNDKNEGTIAEPEIRGENQLVYTPPMEGFIFTTFNFFHGFEMDDSFVDISSLYNADGELISGHLYSWGIVDGKSQDLIVEYNADGKIISEQLYGNYSVDFYAGSGAMKSYSYWPEEYNGNMEVQCNPDGTVTNIYYWADDADYYWTEWDGWYGWDSDGNYITVEAGDLPTAESLAGPELVARVTVNQEDIEIPLTSAGVADLPLGVDEVPVISSTTLEDGKLTIVTSANIEDFNYYETDNSITANIGYIYELNGETHYCWSDEVGEYDPETKTFTVELPEGAVLVSEPRIVINYQIDNMHYYYSIEEDGVYASMYDDLVADFGQSFQYDADGNLVFIQNSIGLDYYMTIRYDENGALESYSYTLNENSRVSFLADGTLEMISYRTEEAYYLYTPEDGWHTRSRDEAGNLIKTPVEAPEGAPNPDELEPLVVVAVKPAKPEPVWFPKNTLGLAGVSMKDLGISSDWHNVAPVDLTKDGTTVFTLVGADAWILGNAYVTVADGNVTVDYALLKGHGYMKSEKMNWFLTKADLTEGNLKAESNYAFGEPVSIADQLGGAETAILFIDSKITFRQPYFDAYNYSTRYYRNRENWKEYREGLIEMIK